ncbi:MAG TPA: hypothetical protein VKH41_11685 [Myxococcota bacterium]|nr:hypothetical protein [Myxococcota bacterium]
MGGAPGLGHDGCQMPPERNRHSARSCREIALIAAICLLRVPAAAITLNQVDDFQSGTVLDWTVGSTLSNWPTGGPGGAGDHYLRVSSGGGNLGTYNKTQWSGDYGAAGVARLTFDLVNFGPDPVSLRITLFTPGCNSGGTACTAWTSTDPIVLPAGSGWVKAEFALAEPDLTRFFGSDTLAASLANIERLLLRHDPDALDPPGVQNPVNAIIGVDNITALPEPTGASGIETGILAILLTKLRRKPKRYCPRGIGWEERKPVSVTAER